jgi:hypothetical protein
VLGCALHAVATCRSDLIKNSGRWWLVRVNRSRTRSWVALAGNNERWSRRTYEIKPGFMPPHGAPRNPINPGSGTDFERTDSFLSPTTPPGATVCHSARYGQWYSQAPRPAGAEVTPSLHAATTCCSSGSVVKVARCAKDPPLTTFVPGRQIH